MAFSAEDQKELDYLNQEISKMDSSFAEEEKKYMQGMEQQVQPSASPQQVPQQQIQPQQQPSIGLTPEEEAELEMLNKETARMEMELVGDQPSQGEAALIGGLRGVALDTLPNIAGASAALGAGYSKYVDEDKSAGEAWDQMKQSYGEAKEEEVQREDELQEAHPWTTGLTSLGGNIATASLTPINSIAKAIGLGVAQSAGYSAGRAKTGEEWAENIAIGAGAGTLGYGSAKVLPFIGKGAKGAARAITPMSVQNAVKTAGEMPKKAVRELQSYLTRIPKKDIETYARNTDKINKLIKKTGGDISEEVNFAKKTIKKNIIAIKSNLNKSIESSLHHVDKKNPLRFVKGEKGLQFDGGFKIDDVWEGLTRDIKKLHPRLHKKALKVLEDTRQMLTDTANDSLKEAVKRDLGDEMAKKLFAHETFGPMLRNLPLGKVSLKTMHEMKQVLYDRISWRQGQIFELGTTEQKILNKILKQAARKLKVQIDKVSPNVEKVNNILHRVHVIDGELSPSILSTKAAEGAFLKVGRAGHKRNTRLLKSLERELDIDFKSIQAGKSVANMPKPPNILKKASDLSAAESFTDPSLLSGGSGYNIIGSKIMGGVLGAGAASGAGQDPTTGFIIGAAVSSPMALKAAINANNIGRKAIRATLDFINNPTAKAVLIKEMTKHGVSLNRVRKRLQKELKSSKKRN